MQHHTRPIPHPHPTFAEQHTPAEEAQVRGRVRVHLLLRSLLVALAVLAAAALVVGLARPNGSWLLAALLFAMMMTLIGMPAWVAGALDTAEDTREDAEFDVEQRHQQHPG